MSEEATPTPATTIEDNDEVRSSVTFGVTFKIYVRTNSKMHKRRFKETRLCELWVWFGCGLYTVKYHCKNDNGGHSGLY